MAFLSLIPIILVGDLLRTAIDRDNQARVDLDLRLVLAWGLGTGTVTFILFYASLVNTQSAYSVTIVVCLLLGAVLVILSVRNRSKVGSLTEFFGRYGIILAALIVVALAVWAVSSQAGLGFDGIAHWGLKAKDSFLRGGWRLSSEVFRNYLNPEYPLLVPSQQGLIYSVVGGVDEQAVKIIFVSFYLALGLLFFRAVRPLYHWFLALIFTLLMMCTPLVAISALVAYADITLMFFIFGSVYFLWRWLRLGGRNDIVFGAIMAGIALLVKRDGVIYWLVSLVLILGLSYGFSFRPKSPTRIRNALILPMIAMVIAGGWYLFLVSTKLRVSSFETPSLSLLFERKDRIVVIGGRLIEELFLSPGQWGILWYIFFFVTLWQFRKLRRSNRLFVWLMVLIPIIVVSFSFLFSHSSAYLSHVDTAFNRLIMHTVPTAWFFIALSTTELNPWFEDLISRRKQLKD